MNSSVFVFGVLAAVLAGIADFFASLVSRKLGSFITLFYMIGSSAALLIVARTFFPHETMTAGDFGTMFLVAGMALLGYLAFYRGLALGPVAIVSPIAACDGAIATLIGVFLLGERLRLSHLAVIVLLVVGVALAATNFHELKRGLRVPSKGPLFALVTMIGFGVAIAGIGYMAARYRSFFLPVLTIRVFIFLQMSAIAAARRQWHVQGAGMLVAFGAFGIGILDTGSLLAFAQGIAAERNSAVAMLGPLYGAYPVITIVLSMLFLKEKLSLNQWVGVALAMIGTMAMALI